ncbi:helix-turn-helix transcriptional regulator [Clostridium botulinum]|uniref:HTH XRE superfamily n=1 Tax=Clostridium botulinum TaxID=1491 RepID=A0A0A0V0A5_CLOBO|nr:helix-turn-helix transcriptional regulator [Clostridium botulinum]AIW54603.1 HTH XRE superfamily [Clostridium botulinum]AIW54723.1 HTH XRE superfamily [Clostridium botulinum]AIW54785.1 HTH XRE superfamily toxin-antitoxin system antitoxin component [Clostridium botulinum]AIW54852.1 HTH XRE superfamily toxin-antitoxin system antitoxin component [Clostridium botulinum]MBY7009276.1 helix-turn-helix transcriptional regulator [Clostridium botulinum]
MKKFKNKLIDIREKNRFSRNDVAKELKKSYDFVAGIEQGTRNINLNEAVKLAKLYKTSIEDIHKATLAKSEI